MVLSSEMEQEGKPKWLLELENRKRTPRLAHEVGAGAPCMKCSLNCPGLDLHFWRKICKNCKCSRDDHDVPNDEFPQFDLLFGKSKNQSNKRKMIVLNVNEMENNKGEIFDWAPPDTTIELAADYMKALPNDKLPIKGSAGAALRKQQLHKQLPLHDIDYKVCDELSESERTQFERYLDNLKKYVGQGKVTKFITAKPFDKSQMTPANASECLTPKHKLLNDHHNLNLRTPSSFVPKISPPNINSNEFLNLDQDGNLLMGYPTRADSRNEMIRHPETGNVSLEATKLGRYHHTLDNIKNDSDLAKSNIVPGTRGYSPVNQENKNYLQHPHTFDSIKNNYGLVNSTGIDPAFQGNSNNPQGIRSGYLDNSLVPSVGIEGQILRSKSPDTRFIQSNMIGKSFNPAVHFAQTNIHNYDNNSDSITSKNLPYAHQLQKTGGYQPGELTHSEGLMGSPESYGKPGQQLETHSKHPHLIENSKNNYDLINSTRVPSYQQHNYHDDGQDSQYSSRPSENIDSQVVHSRNPEGHLVNSELINKSFNPAFNLPQTNINSDNFNNGSVSSTNNPYLHQFQRTNGIYPGEFTNEDKTLQAHHWPNKNEWPGNNNKINTLNDNFHNKENSILADKILSEALLPPSSINSGDIVGSTLDQQGLNYIREKLTSKYADKDDSIELNNSLQAKNSGLLSKNSIGQQSKPADAHLSSYGGVHPNLIHSQEQNISVFPEEIVGSSRLMENPATDYLGSAMNNLSMIQKKVQNCHQCQEDIVVGDVVVTAEKAKDAAWHPGCFVCSVCNELLVDLVYFYYKGKLYCGRDLAGLLEIPRCFACDELIFVREYTVAEGHNYHVKHFCCWDCDVPLAGQQYISEDDKPLCLPCYKKLYAKSCNTCCGVIAPDQLGVAVKHLDFHATDECFCCADCKKSLLNGKIAIKNDKPFCSKECITKYFE